MLHQIIQCVEKRTTGLCCVVEMSNCLKMTQEDSSQFKSILGISDWTPNEDTLRAIIAQTLRKIPFTNIMMLTRDRRPPSCEEILNDMLSMKGGPCGHYNPFMASFLTTLGFDCSLVPAWMNSVLCHIAIIVKLANKKFWIDCGNGHPYLSPLELRDGVTASHAGLVYRIVKCGEKKYQLFHKHSDQGDFELNYEFMDQPVEFDFFDQMVKSHYMEEDFGPFLTGLRLIMYPNDELFAIRNKELLTTEKGALKKHKFGDLRELTETIESKFVNARYPMDGVFESLGWT